jgi:hypothetical protein
MSDLTRKRGDMNPIAPSTGLHRLKGDFQKTYLAEQCDALVSSLDEAIAATIALAPVRTQGYFGQTRGTRAPQHPEARWEQATWEQWSTTTCAAVPGAWYRLAHYQLNLPHTREDEAWGEIDLVGISHQGLPVIVELKAPDATDSPVAMLVQAAAYALAFRKAWHTILPEWTALVRRYGFDLTFTDKLHLCPLVCAAPTRYWNEWLGDSPRAQKVTAGTWPALMRLVLALAERGLPATFVRLDHAHEDDDGLPRLIRASVIDPFGAAPK